MPAKRTKAMSSDSERVAMISMHELYRVDEARARLGIGVHAWRQMHRQGLVVHYAGGRAYVCGSQIIEHLKKRTSTDKIDPTESAANE